MITYKGKTYPSDPHWIPLDQAPPNAKLYMGDFATNMMGIGFVKEEKGIRTIEWTWTFRGVHPTHYWSF